MTNDTCSVGLHGGSKNGPFLAAVNCRVRINL